jgi:tetratricopeptide (TPR) repeat protein
MVRLCVIALFALLVLAETARAAPATEGGAERAEPSPPVVPELLEEESTESALERGKRLHDAGDFDGAVQLYRALLRKYPLDPVVRYELMCSTHARGDAATARQMGEELLKNVKNPSAAVYVLLGSIYDQQGDLQLGEKTFKQGLKKHPDVAILHFNLGVNLTQQKKMADAERAYVESLKRNPRHPGSWLHLGGVSRELKLPANAVAAYARFLTLEPESQRSPRVAKAVWDILFEGVKPADTVDAEGDRDVTITLDLLSPGGLGDAVGMQALVLPITAAKRWSKEWAGKTDEEFLPEALEAAADMAGSQTKHASFWTACTADYFKAAKEAGHMAALGHDIRRSLNDATTLAWIDAHVEAVQKYRAWAQTWGPPGCAPRGH